MGFTNKTLVIIDVGIDDDASMPGGVLPMMTSVLCSAV